MAGEVSLPGEITKTGVVCKIVHAMLSPLITDTSNLYCLASVSSLISTGYQNDCSFIFEKELTPMYLPDTRCILRTGLDVCEVACPQGKRLFTCDEWKRKDVVRERTLDTDHQKFEQVNWSNVLRKEVPSVLVV
jgi:hypothetical protein